MKNAIAKLKAAGFKKLMIDHGEKVVAGVIGLMLLFALLGTTWSQYQRTPKELTDDVEKAKLAIAQNKWETSEDAQKNLYTPAAGLKEEQIVELLPGDEDKRIALVSDRQNYYAYSTEFFRSLINRNEPASQPDTPPVEALRAVAGRAIIPKASAVAFDQFAEVPAEAADDSSGKRLKADFTTSGPGGAGGPGRPPMPGGAAFVPGGPAGRPGAEMMGPGMPGGGGGIEAGGMRYVSVRGIVPLLKQVEMMKAALNVSDAYARANVQYWDFRLERRLQGAGGTGAWSPWEAVDIRTAKDVLNEAAGWDPEVVEISLTDPVLTMALPTRVMYEWSKEESSHPMLDNYVLPPAERDRQMQLYEGFLTRQIETMGAVNEETPRGFGDMQQGSRQFSSPMAMPGMGRGAMPARAALPERMSMPRGMPGGPGMGAMGASPDAFIGSLANELDPDNPETKRALLKRYMESQRAAGRLLLFRYFDFDVKPGNTYQYRVQLVLKNPNFEQPHHMVIDPEITKEKYLTTPFSEPTDPVTVPEDAAIYVAQVDEAKGANPPTAKFDVYQWTTEYGTTLKKQIEVWAGGFVAAREAMEVVDVPNKLVIENQEIDFKSNDALIDVFAPPSNRPIKVATHPDLQDVPKNKLDRGLGVAEQVLVIDEYGQLKALNPVSRAQARKADEEEYEQEQVPLDQIKEMAKGNGAEGAAGFERYEAAFGPGGDPKATSGRGRRGRVDGRALRRGAGAAGAGPPMMPGRPR